MLQRLLKKLQPASVASGICSESVLMRVLLIILAMTALSQLRMPVLADLVIKSGSWMKGCGDQEIGNYEEVVASDLAVPPQLPNCIKR